MTAAPMTATLDATLSGPTSNTYITLAEATAIAQNLPFGPEWNTTSDNDLALALTTATGIVKIPIVGGVAVIRRTPLCCPVGDTVSPRKLTAKARGP